MVTLGEITITESAQVQGRKWDLIATQKDGFVIRFCVKGNEFANCPVEDVEALVEALNRAKGEVLRAKEILKSFPCEKSSQDPNS